MSVESADSVAMGPPEAPAKENVSSWVKKLKPTLTRHLHGGQKGATSSIVSFSRKDEPQPIVFVTCDQQSPALFFPDVFFSRFVR